MNSKKYWLEQLKDNILPISIPYDYEESKNYKANSVFRELPREVGERLVGISKNTDLSLYLLLLTSFKILLYKYSGVEDFTVGSPVYTKGNSAVLLDKFVVLRDTIQPQNSFKENLANIRGTVLSAYDHQNYPIHEIMEEIYQSKEVTNARLFKSICLLTNIHEHDTIKESNADIITVFEKEETKIKLTVNYNENLYKNETIQLFVDRLTIVLEEVINNPSIIVSDIKILSDSEEELIFNSFSNMKETMICDKMLKEIFEEQVMITPDQVALEDENRKITYRQLDDEANQLARLLQQKGVTSNILVGIICKRSVEMVIGILAIFKAGGAYIPIDPKYPQERIMEILLDSQIKTILTLSDTFADVEILNGHLIKNTLVENIIYLDKCEEKQRHREVLKAYAIAKKLNSPVSPIQKFDGYITYDGLQLSYGDCLHEVKKVVRFLEDQDLANGTIGVMFTNPLYQIISIMAIKKLNLPFEDLNLQLSLKDKKELVDTRQLRVVLTESKHVDEADELLWETRLKGYLLLDEYKAEENQKEQNFKLLWNSVATESSYEINDYGWRNSYDGERFSIQEMEEYINNFKTKLQPFLSKDSKVLEIGCGHGLVYSELVNQVGEYHATDLSDVIIERNKQRAKENNINHITFEVMPAYRTGEYRGQNFNMVLCSSVIHYFPNTAYLEEVIKGAIEALNEKGLIYLDDIMNLYKKKDLEVSTKEYKAQNPDKRTKTDWSKDLFVAPEFFDMLKFKFPEIVSWSMSDKLGKISNELNKYRYDVMLVVDKSKKHKTFDGVAPKKLFNINEINHYWKQITEAKQDYIDSLIDETVVESMGDISSLDDLNSFNNLSADSLAILQEPSDISYVIYTSGTTGKPKGATVEHLGMINHIHAKINDLNMTSDTRIVQNASQCFDISVWQMFAALMVGGSVFIYSDDLIMDMERFIDKVEGDKITILQVVPSYLSAMLDYLEVKKKSLSDLEFLIATGEELKKHLVKRWFNLYPSIKLVNAYGPTEASDDVTHYIFDKVPESQLIPIGKAIQNFNIYILDKDNRIMPIGLPGEICVSGIGVGKGYLYKPELTSKVFMKDPFNEKAKLYRTGDLGRWLVDGNIEFLGRIDNQVKIRGFRIELGEIESVLLELPDIKKAIVIDRANDQGEKYLCGYLIIDGELKENEIKESIQKKLPEYMIPAYFVEIDKIPLTANGKIDRKGLPDPSSKSENDYVPPRTQVEEQLAAVWRDVLSTKTDVGINDNYFTLGGDSIKAIQISARLQKYHLKVEIHDIFNYPTIAELSGLVQQLTNKWEQGTVTGEAGLTPIQQDFFEADTKDQNHYNQSIMLFNRNGIDIDSIKAAFSKVIAHHDALRMTFKFDEFKITQINNGIEDFPLEFEIHNLRDQKEHELEIKKIADIRQRSFNLEKGPLVKLNLFTTDVGDYLHILIHHLVIDGVSWRIILEDLVDLYNQIKTGKTMALPPKTAPYYLWSNELNKYATSMELLKEVEYWKQLENFEIPKLPKDHILEMDLVEYSATKKVHLSPQETERLINEANEAYHTEINDLLLSALYLAMVEWSGQKELLISLEGHGRENIIKDIDISRTVGWFTSIFPVVLRTSSLNISNAIKDIKEILHRIPNKGIGYGILKYITPKELVGELNFNLNAEIGFNYLGRVDSHMEAQDFKLSSLDSGEHISPHRNREHVISINCGIVNGSLEVNVEYNRDQYNDLTINGLAELYSEKLKLIINHCVSRETSEMTPSDFSDEDLSSEDVEEFFEYIEDISDEIV